MKTMSLKILSTGSTTNNIKKTQDRATTILSNNRYRGQQNVAAG